MNNGITGIPAFTDHWSVADPQRMGHDPVSIESVSLSDDRRSVHLKIPGIRPVMQMKINYQLDGLTATIHNTIHRLSDGAPHGAVILDR